MPDQIQFSHLEQTAYFAALHQGGIQVLDVESIGSLVTVSRSHAMKLLVDMARKGAL